MAPTPPAITLSIADPISADVQVALNSLTAMSNFLSTPEGQLFCAKIRTDAAWLESGIGKFLTTVSGFLHLRLSKL